MQLVLVKWRDAEAAVDWQRAGDVKVSKPMVYSLGWLVGKTESEIIICADLASGGADGDLDTNRRCEIPTGMVEKMMKVQLATMKGEVLELEKSEKKPKPKPKKPGTKKGGY